MRKIDYEILAACIRYHLAAYGAVPGDGAMLALQALRSVAKNLSEKISVDKSEFRKACGLD